MAISTPIFNMFGRSPIRPLQRHIAKALACAEALPTFFDAAIDQNWQDAQKLRNTIAQLEREADDIKKDLRLHLPKGLFLPVARGDVLELITMQDKIANKAKDISGLVLGREMTIPDTVSADYRTLLETSINACAQAAKAINELDELLETGFRGNEIDIVEAMIQKLNDIEHTTDDMQVDIRHRLYEIEKQLNPIDAMFLYNLIQWTGELADCAQAVGGRLQIMLAH